MNRIQRINLFLCLYCLIALTALIIFSVNQTIYASTFSKVVALIVLATLAIAGCYFIYFFWRKCQPQDILIIGDSFTEKELLLTNYQNNNPGNLFLPKIIPSALLTNDSPRARLQLKQLKGSCIAPPHILIVVNAEHFCRSNDGEQILLTHNLNRLLHLLHHDDQDQQIDLTFTHTEKIPGYTNFLRWATLQQKPLKFTSEQSLRRQLEAYKNYSHALTQLAPNEFLAVISFFSAGATHIGLLEKLIENLLLKFSGTTGIFFAK